MKNSLLLFSILFLLCFNLADAQSNLPDSSHVLVVYNTRSTESIQIKNYYKNARGIQDLNIVGLDDLDTLVTITDPLSGVPHQIALQQGDGNEKEIIVDTDNYGWWTVSRHAWIYFNERIAKPIADALQNRIVNNDTLKNHIRFIVLCRGIPFRIQARLDDSDSRNQNVPVDGLLCFLGETINDPDALLDLFNSEFAEPWDSVYIIPNPYYNVDPYFSMDHNFIPNHYKGSFKLFNIQDRDITLSYLITHLDATSDESSVNVVKNMIDSSIAAINSSGYDWFIDSDQTPCAGSGLLQAYNTLTTFNALNITNYFIVDDDPVYTSYGQPIMSYSSNGRHASADPYNNCNLFFNPDYIQTQLTGLTYLAGAIINTAESFNVTTLGTYQPIRRADQGQITEFFFMGGTVGVGQVYHGSGGGGNRVIENSIILPSYALGYSFIEAAYMGMKYLTDNRVFVGDPLTRIALPCEPTIISNNTTLPAGNYDCDIIVEEGAILNIDVGVTVNFIRNAQLLINGTLNISSGAYVTFNGYSNLAIDNSGTLVNENNANLVFYDYSKLILNNELSFDNNLNINFQEYSEFEDNGILIIEDNVNITFSNNSKFSVLGTVYLHPGATATFYNSSRIWMYGHFYSQGDLLNPVILNFSNYIVPQLYCPNGKTLEISNTVVNNGCIQLSLSEGQNVENLSITSTTFNNTQQGVSIRLNLMSEALPQIPVISNCVFNNGTKPGIELSRVQEINLEHNTFNLSGSTEAVKIVNSGSINVLDCIFNGSEKGIFCQPAGLEDDEIEFDENLITDININLCYFSTSIGIEIGRAIPTAIVTINGNHFENCNLGISIYDLSTFIPEITNNIMSGRVNPSVPPSQCGISISGGNQVLISYNTITNFSNGITLSNVSAPIVKENFITAIDLEPIDRLSGIISVSSNGEIRNNTIRYHRHGIELGSSSPFIGANTITDNLYYGMYISSDSHPDLSEAFVGEEQYPLSGYNTIRENGLCNQINYSELYLVKSTITLEKGCNTIADDREEPLNCGYFYLIDGEGVEEEISANRNYWGEINGSDPEGRFGEGVTVNYEEWLEEPCTYEESSSFLILANSKGDVYDTVYSTGVTASELTDIETRYATANAYYYNNQYSQAKQGYEGIIQNYGSSTGSLQAYNRLYTLANLMSSSQAEFNQLKEFYLQKAGNQTDSIMIGTLTHLSDLCLVSAEEYLPAINNFDEIAQQNPNTDIALYRQIDALTTALLLPQDSTLNKGILGKYSVNNLSDYTDKLSELLRTRGRSGIEGKKDLLPTEYTLYQNYPNPFNPTTTIKYDLPNTSDVALAVYDILGRKVKELVNTKQQAGRYEVQFDASNLASGVYIYQLITEKYMSSRKMILLK